MSGIDLAFAIDDLYASAVMQPDQWTESSFASWLQDLGSDSEVTREQAKHVRRALRIAAKLSRYWAGRSEGHDDWRVRVDEAVGIPAWRPQLALATIDLERDGSEEAFDEVTRRFREVHFTPFLGGISYADWAGNREQPSER